MSAFSSAETWSVLIQIFLIAVALLAGNIIRRKVSFMNRSLIPTALIGGLLIFLLKIFPWFNVIIDKPTMEIITYHALALGFISMALRGSQVKGRTATTKVIESGMSCWYYVIQGIGRLLLPYFYLSFLCSVNWGRFFMQAVTSSVGYGQGPDRL